MNRLLRIGTCSAIFTLASHLPALGQPVPPNFATVCPQAAAGYVTATPVVNQPALFPQGLGKQSLSQPWQRRYPLLVYDVLAAETWRQASSDAASSAEDAASLWAQANDLQSDAQKAQQLADAALGTQVDADSAQAKADKAELDASVAQAKSDSKNLAPMPQIAFWYRPDIVNGFTPIPNISLMSRLLTTEKFGVLLCNARIGDTYSVTSTAYIPKDAYAEDDIPKNVVPSPRDLGGFQDRIYFIDTAAGNDVVLVHLSFAGTPAIAITTNAIERHRLIRFSAGSGLLVTRGTNFDVTVSSIEGTETSTTSVDSSTTVNGVLTSSTSTRTPSLTKVSQNYAFITKGSPEQFNTIVGVTWYPFGYDSFPVTNAVHTTDYAHYGKTGLFRPIGFFFGTSANTLGNFTVAPTYEVTPGLQLFAGATLWNKVRIKSDTIACNGLGNSPSFSDTPTTTATEVSTTTASDGTITRTSKTTTVEVSTISGCKNGNLATILPNMNAPTQSSLTPAVAFGVIFNTNLVGAFGSLFKGK